MLKFTLAALALAIAAISCTRANVRALPAGNGSSAAVPPPPPQRTIDYGTDEPRSVFQKVVRILLMYEILAVATGTHMMRTYDADVAVDKRNHVIAASAFELWLHLPTAEKANELIDDVTTFVFENAGSNAANGTTNAFFENVDRVLANEPVVRERYAQAKGRVEGEMSSPSWWSAHHLDRLSNTSTIYEIDVNAAVENQTLRNPLVKLGFVHSRFMKLYALGSLRPRNTTEYEYFATAKAILEMAGERRYVDAVQRIYKTVISEVGEKWLTIFVGAGNVPEDNIDKMLFARLAEKFENDSDLGSEFKSRKKSVTEI